jgi:hypothetical protein
VECGRLGTFCGWRVVVTFNEFGQELAEE